MQLQRCQVDPQVQSTVMAELNAITDKLEEWNEAGSESIYFCLIINSVNKTWRVSGSSVKYFKCRVRQLDWKMIDVNLIELNCNLEDCEY
jgi:hypothetical protein